MQRSNRGPLREKHDPSPRRLEGVRVSYVGITYITKDLAQRLPVQTVTGRVSADCTFETGFDVGTVRAVTQTDDVRIHAAQVGCHTLP